MVIPVKICMGLPRVVFPTPTPRSSQWKTGSSRQGGFGSHSYFPSGYTVPSVPSWGEIRLLNDMCDDTYSMQCDIDGTPYSRRQVEPERLENWLAGNEVERKIEGVGLTWERLVIQPTCEDGLPHMYTSEVRRIWEVNQNHRHDMAHFGDATRVVIAVRGSSCYADWRRNALCKLRASECLEGTPLAGLGFHTGFLEAAEALLPKAQAALQAAAQRSPGQLLITVTGHSLGSTPDQSAGGATALLLGTLLKWSRNTVGTVEKVVTYGQPMVTDLEGAFALRNLAFAHQTVPLYRIVNQMDIVVSLPPSTLMGYRHFGQGCVINPPDYSRVTSAEGLREIELKLDAFGFATSNGDVQSMRFQTYGVKYHTIYRESIGWLKELMACGGYVMPPYEKEIWTLSPFLPSDAYNHPARQSDGEGLVLASDQDHYLSDEGRRSRIGYRKEANRGRAEHDEVYMREKAKELLFLK